MVDTAVEGVPGGFEILMMTVLGGETSGEGFLGAPDGSILHLDWRTPDDIHFEEVLSVEDSQVAKPLGDEEAAHLQSLFPELWRAAEEGRAATPQRIEVLLPSLESQWEAWRATQAE
jgi:hypothetical protein